MKQSTHIPRLALPGSSTPARLDTAPRNRHGNLTILLHWSSVLAILLATGAILTREAVEDDAWRNALLDIHRKCGLFVLVALGLRLVVRLTSGMADFTHDMPRLLRLGAAAAHAALYGMLLALPLLGWATTSAHGVKLRLFGLVTLPSIARKDSDLADTLGDWHLWFAWGLLALVCMHVAAACWHHYSRRDRVLSAMLPFVRSRADRLPAVSASRMYR